MLAACGPDLGIIKVFKAHEKHLLKHSIALLYNALMKGDRTQPHSMNVDPEHSFVPCILCY